MFFHVFVDNVVETGVVLLVGVHLNFAVVSSFSGAKIEDRF